MIGQTDTVQINEQGDTFTRERRYALVVTSHRGLLYLPETIQLAAGLAERCEQVVLVDDSGTQQFRCGDFLSTDLVSHSERHGLAVTVDDAWSAVRPEITHVFHLEEDFHLLEPVDLDAMADTLDEFGNLSQLVLKRQAWSPEEQAAGGIVEMHPDQYVEVNLGGRLWTQHHRLFSLNPSLIPARVIRGGWPASNERGMTDRILDQGGCFGYWGGKHDPPRCLHVGSQGGMGSAGWAA